MERGEELYRRHCWMCHGATGTGDGPLAAQIPSPSLRGPLVQARRPELVQVIVRGSGLMPAYDASFSQGDARRILVWLASLDEAPPAPPVAAPPEPSPEPVEPP